MKSAFTFLAFMAFRALTVSAATYGYTVFYEKGSDACANSAVNLHPWISGEDFDISGASSSDQMCSTQSVCALNHESEQCQSLDPGVEVLVNITVLPNGTELLCRNKTDCVLSPRCSNSVSYPNCSLSLMSQAALLADPTVIKNTQFPASAINQTVYVVYYSDSRCSEVVGLYGYVTGNNSAVNVTRPVASVSSCSDAMACLVNSAGASCQAVGTNGTVQVIMHISDDGSGVNVCVDGACEVRLPSQCIPSAVFGGCYFKPVNGKGFFENPSQYLPSPAPCAPAAGPTPARPTSSALPKTHHILDAGLAVLQALLV